jgi:hypothetical protein
MSVMENPAALAARRRRPGPLLAEIRARREEFAKRFVPKDFIAQLKKVGVYRAATRNASAAAACRRWASCR